MIVPCECGAKLKVDDAKISAKGTKVRCPRCGTIQMVQPKPVQEPAGFSALSELAPSAPSGPLVLIAHDSEPVRGMIRDVLLEAGFSVEAAANGVEALKKATELKPLVMVLDVGLSGIYGFELCERLKDNEQTAAMKIVLITSLYDATRYKRSPVSLYGADDYIEKHQISEFLTLKIRKLLYPEQYANPEQSVALPAPDVTAPLKTADSEEEHFQFKPESLLKEETEPAAPGARAAQATQIKGEPAPSAWLDSFIHHAQDGAAMAPDSFTLESSIFQKNENDIPAVNAEDPEAVEKAKRLARIIVSDIALYNPDTVIEGLRSGTFYELLKSDIDEGRELYERRVSKSIRSKKDYYQEAFDNFIETHKKIVR